MRHQTPMPRRLQRAASNFAVATPKARGSFFRFPSMCGGRCRVACFPGFEGDCSELARDVFSAVCKHSSSLYVLAFDTNLQPGIKTW